MISPAKIAVLRIDRIQIVQEIILVKRNELLITWLKGKLVLWLLSFFDLVLLLFFFM